MVKIKQQTSDIMVQASGLRHQSRKQGSGAREQGTGQPTSSTLDPRPSLGHQETIKEQKSLRVSGAKNLSRDRGSGAGLLIPGPRSLIPKAVLALALIGMVLRLAFALLPLSIHLIVLEDDAWMVTAIARNLALGHGITA